LPRPGQRKYSPELQADICRLIRLGNPVEVASEAAGITPETFYVWMRSRRAFRLAIEQARGEAEAILVGRVQKAAQAGSWRAACWLLERRWPERWAPLADRAHADGELDRELDRILADK
jgi:transposase-like protein